MENTSKSPNRKKRKLSTKVLEKIVPFNKIRKRYLPKNYSPNLDIRDYFSSSSKHSSKLSSGLTNGENQVDTELNVENEDLDAKIQHPFFSHALDYEDSDTEKVCNGNLHSSEEAKGVDQRLSNGHLESEISTNLTESGPTVYSTNDLPALNHKDLNNSSLSHVTYDCRSLTESPFKVNGCELKPCLSRLSTSSKLFNSFTSLPSKSNLKSNKRKSGALREGWITKKPKKEENTEVLASISSLDKNQKLGVYEEPFEVENIIDYSWCKERVNNS